MSKKTLAVVVTALVFLGMPVFAQDYLLVGCITQLSGVWGDFGKMETYGQIMAVEEANARGGVLGKEVKLLIEDSGMDPAVAAQKAVKMIEKDKVAFLTGSIMSACANSISETAQKYWVVYMNCNTNSNECTGTNNHRVNFRVCPSNNQLTYTSGPYFLENFGKRWYFFTQDGTWGRTAAQNFKDQLLAAGGEVVGEDLIPLGTRDFSSHLIKLQSLKPSTVILTIGGLDYRAWLEQVYDFGMQDDFNIGMTLKEMPDHVAIGAERNLGAYALEWYHRLDAPGVKEFVKRYQERFPDAKIKVPDNNVYYGYLGVREALRAIERAGTTYGPAVIKQLEGHWIYDNMKYNPSWFRPWDHQLIQDVFVAKAKDPAEMEDPFDFNQIVGMQTGEKIARTREQNPVQLEPLPGE